ncbi:MAG: hypothetical protein KGH61_02565 [Candidatus Micrarchaeota archaeon]|nr:hypothetical protein [Candidatus Micrarchaeota archaeon]
MRGLSDKKLHKRIIGVEFQYRNYLSVQNSDSSFYYVFYDTASVRREAKIIGRIGKSLGFARGVIEKSVMAGSSAVDFARKIERYDLSKKSLPELLGLFLEFVNREEAIMPVTVITAAVELYLEGELKEAIAKELGGNSDVESLMIALTTPDRRNVPYEEQVSLLKIAMKMKKSKVGPDIRKHVKEYGWLGSRFDVGEPWTEEEVEERGKSIESPDVMLGWLEQEEEEAKRSFSVIAKRLKPSSKLVELAKMAKEFTWLRTYRTDALNEALGRAKGLIDEIGKRYALPYGYSHYLTVEEILEGRIPSGSEIEQRIKKFAFVFTGLKGKVLTGKEVDKIQKFAEETLLGFGAPGGGVVKGIVANKPFKAIRGIAKIINSIEDTSKLKEGEILIATMTEPNFIPAMERASAFVTNEGGILCHAAIVSREMKKPCIIGTGTATRAFESGDEIELDLESGTVKRIEGQGPWHSDREKLAREMDKVNLKTLVSREGMPFASDLWGPGSAFRSDRYFQRVLWGKKGNAPDNWALIGRYASYDMDSIAKTAKTITEYTKNRPQALLAHAMMGRKLGAKLEKFTLKIKEGNFKGVPKEKLISLLSEFLELVSAVVPYLTTVLAIERHLQDTIREGILEIVEDKTDINLMIVELTSPPEHDAVYKERVDLLRIAERYRSGKGIEKGIDRHIDQYGNVCIRWCMGRPWTHEELRQKIYGIKNPKEELEKLASEERKINSDFEKFEHAHPDRKELFEFIRIAKWYVWLRTYRTEVLSGAIANIYPLLSEIAVRFGTDLDGIRHYTIAEILEDKRLGDVEIERRKEAFVVLLLSKKKYIFSGSDAKYFIDHWERKHPIAREIKGTVANKPVGSKIGVAKIVLRIRDVPKVGVGDILVAPMTEPNFIHAMERASAFITDEGGILCHAAIVGREMNKPCIIGTGNATKALSDGDFVRMNMDDGTITKISKEEYLEHMNRLESKEKSLELAKIPEESSMVEIRPDLVLGFDQISKKDLPLVGGKGANLGEMFSRFPVPHGFCITVNAYKRFMKESGIENEIFGMLKNLDITNSALLDKTSEKIRRLILKSKMPLEVREEILTNYAEHSLDFVAVRSSATAEDLPTLSFAGQQDTYLNMRGEKELLESVKRCWASLFTSRAIYYRVTNNFHHEAVLISVVVQRMVDSEKSGVMFSVNPISKDEDEIIIESSYGLGEAIVSGQVTPDSFILSKKALEIKQERINSKKIAIVKGKGGKNQKIILDDRKAKSKSLSYKEIIGLAKLAIALEKHYAKPQDIEWAIDRSGKAYILQSRPITTL